MYFQYLEISWDQKSLYSRQLKIKKHLTPSKQLDKNATCLRKLTIIAPFFLAIIFYFLNKKIKKEQKRSLKKKIKKVKKKVRQTFFFYFLKLPPTWGMPSTSSAPSMCLWWGWAEDATESSSSKCWPGYTYFVLLNWLWKVEIFSWFLITEIER
jgi:hypothetical protein